METRAKTTALRRILAMATLAALVAAPRAATAAEGLVLVEEGKSRAPIVVFEGAPPRTREAADELAGYIEKMSGARPEVVEDEPDPIPDQAIWVGYQPVLDDLFPGVDFDFEHPEEILIAANQNHVVIAGRDRWDPEHLFIRYNPEHGKRVAVQFEYGTANAVYTFLRDQLGVRWLWPGELGEEVPARKTIVLVPMEYRHWPRIRSRTGLFNSMARGHRLGRGNDWIRYQRIALESLEANAGGHGFSDWWNRFHETHPEYFALQPDGTRSGYPEPGNAKMCHSNPGVATQWIADVAAEIEQNPLQRVFNASPNDSGHSGHCICENCLAWDHPDARNMFFSWQGLGQEYGAISDRQVTFANRVARRLKAEYPDRDYYVSLMAYGTWRPAPVEAVPDDNVIIVNVANMFWSIDNPGARGGQPPAEQYADWGKLTDNQMWRPNTGDPAGWQKGLPDVPFHRVAEAITFVDAQGCIGLFVDLVWNHWSTQGPLYYLMAHLAWDPDLDVDEVMEDYYRCGFGPAGDELKAYWTLLEEARNRKVDDYPGAANGYAEVYDEAFFARAYGLLERAAEKAAGTPGKYADRVAFVRVGLDYTKQLADIRALVARYREGGQEDAALADAIRARWETIRDPADEYPLALNWRLIQPGSRGMRRGGGLHPDYLR